MARVVPVEQRVALAARVAQAAPAVPVEALSQVRVVQEPGVVQVHHRRTVQKARPELTANPVQMVQQVPKVDWAHSVLLAVLVPLEHQELQSQRERLVVVALQELRAQLGVLEPPGPQELRAVLALQARLGPQVLQLVALGLPEQPVQPVRRGTPR